MPTKRSRLFLLAAAALPAGAVLLALWAGPRRAEVGPDGSPEHLHEALTRAGVAYEAQAVPRSDTQDAGLYLKRAGDGRAWDEVTSLPRSYPAAWRGCLVVRTVASEPSPVREGAGCFVFGRLVLYGDPAEIRRSLAALR
jgi:hypothetical protein